MMVVEQFNESIYESSGKGFCPGLRWVDMQNYRDPPPYPGHSKQVYSNQPGFRQSFSGSETSTDVSLSSTENLATSQRQEPQGEETQTSFNYHLDLGGPDSSSYSILERLGMPASALDSAGKFSGIGTASRSSAGYSQDTSGQGNDITPTTVSGNVGISATPSPLYSQGHLSVPQWQLTNVSQYPGEFSHQQQTEMVSHLGKFKSVSSSRSVAESSYSSSSSASTLTMISREGAGNYSSYVSSTSRGLSGGGTPGHNSLPLPSYSNQYLSPRVPPVSTYHHPHPYVNTHWTVGSGDSSSSSHSSITSFPISSTSTYSQSGVTGSSHAGHSLSLSYLTNLPPPPKYPGPKTTFGSSLISEKGADIRACKSYETMDKVDDQKPLPDLRLCASSPGIFMPDMKFQSPHRSANNSADDSDQAAIAAQASMVEMLTEENRALHEELALSAGKVAKLQKFEMEIQKVHESHEALVKSSNKRESLWLAMKRKLEERIQALEAAKRGDTGTGQSSSTDTEHGIKLAEKDSMISKLLSQNQELSRKQNESEAENVQLNLSLGEHRARVEILENALLNAQSKVLTLEEQCRHKQVYVDKVEQLQNALTTLQSASEKQEKKEKEMRIHLEKELETYKSLEKGGALKKSEPGKDDGKSMGMLRKMLDEKDARILQLETEMAALEQKYVKEATLRQLSMDETTQASKDVRRATFEKSSSNMEKLIDEAKTEKLKHMEELHQSQRKVAELEAEVKQLQTQLVEKEAMVKAFQRSPLSMARSSSLHALCHSSLHSPRPSVISQAWSGGAGGGTGQSQELSGTGNYREFATIRHVKAGSASAVELGRNMSVEEDLLSKVQGLNTESKSDSEDEGRLFHV